MSEGRYAILSANRDKLDSCPRHRFVEGFAIEIGVRVKCEGCGGELTLPHLNQYIRGYEAAGGDGNDILPGWR